MHLELAVVLSCTAGGCQVQTLMANVPLYARYSEPMLEHKILAHPDHLVAIDCSVAPYRIVYRYPDIQVVGAGLSRPGREPSPPLNQTPFVYGLLRDGHPIEPAQLRSETFADIEALYARMEAAARLDPKQVVEQGYDHIAERYLAWAESDASGMRERYANVLLQELPPSARVLELGCGAGIPITRTLAQRFEVTGIDISARQIALARQHVPQAHFIRADMTELDLLPESYDGVAAFYALIHIPREQQPQLLRDITSWLTPGGLLVVTMGARASRGDIEEDWLGAPMYWSSFDSQTNLRLVREAGLEIVQARKETVEEHGEQATFLWIVARKPRGRPGDET